MTKEDIIQKILKNPAEVESLSKEELASVYGTLDAMLEELDSAKSVVKETIFSLIDADSEEVGEYLAMRIKKPIFKDLTLEKARDLGLTKMEEKIDTNLAKSAWKSGADIGTVEFDEILTMRKRESK